MMNERLIIWLIVGPLLLAVVAPLIQAGLPRRGLPIHAIGHLVLLAAAVATFLLPTQSVIVAMQTGGLGVSLSLGAGRPVAAELTVAALLFLAISLASDQLARSSRHGVAFLSLLAIAQGAVNLVFLASDLLALYAGLAVLSLCLTVMIGLDFSDAGRDAGLRVLITLEAPAAVALASFWLIDAQTGTLDLAEVPSRIQSLGPTSALLLLLPILIALIARVALAPLQHWVVVGSRVGAAPVAVTIAALAVPVGGVVFARLVGIATLGNPDLLHALALLAALSAVLAGLGALWETNALGMLAYLAMAQVSLAAVGFATPDGLGAGAGWVGLGGGALALTLLGLGLTSAVRASRDTALARLSAERVGWLSAAAVTIGSLALAPVPPFATFEARAMLLSSLVLDGTNWGMLAALLTVLATFLVTIGALRLPLALVRSQSPETVGAAENADERPPRQKGRRRVRLAPASDASLPRAIDQLGDVAVALVGLIALNVLVGLVPVAWLAGLVGASLTTTPLSLHLACVVLVGVVVLVAVRAVDAPAALAGRLPVRATRGVQAILLRYHPERAVDPYLTFGFLLLHLGRLSATILDNTLGRLARAG
ncbi:MAG TPA: proton-conducting transporter membrane subunit [Chloroflexota bacterium]|nr:proton-conducting transporter membrane subunit [Chloroflexota bacterium]